MFIVTVNNGGHDWYLRGTVWTSQIDRATTCITRVIAENLLAKATGFMTKRIAKAARVIEVP